MEKQLDRKFKGWFSGPFMTFFFERIDCVEILYLFPVLAGKVTSGDEVNLIWSCWKVSFEEFGVVSSIFSV